MKEETSQYHSLVKNLCLDKALEKTNVLNLKRISSNNLQSKHIVICISGFLSQDVDKREAWGDVVNHYRNAEVFALTWNSLSAENLFEEGAYQGKKKKNGFQKAFSLVRALKKQFLFCIRQAEIAGTLLALFL